METRGFQVRVKYWSSKEVFKVGWSGEFKMENVTQKSWWCFWWSPKILSLHQVLCERTCTCIRVFLFCVCGIFMYLYVCFVCPCIFVCMCACVSLWYVHVFICVGGIFMCLYMCGGDVHVFIYVWEGCSCVYILCVCGMFMCLYITCWGGCSYVYICGGGIFMCLYVCMSPFLSILEIPSLLGCFSNSPIKNSVDIVLILKFALHSYLPESLFQTRASLFHLLKAVLYTKRLYRQ